MKPALSQDLLAFQALLDRFATMAAIAGDRIVAYRGDFPQAFAALPESERYAVHQRFAAYVALCSDALGAGDTLRDQHLFWRAISAFGLRPPADMFDKLEPGDLLEIYEYPSFVQSFRSYDFYRLCSHTLDDVLCKPWYLLYKRDEAITAELMETAIRATLGQPPKIEYYEVGPHTLDEVGSPGLFHAELDSRFVAPLMNARNEVKALANVAKPIRITPRAGTWPGL